MLSARTPLDRQGAIAICVAVALTGLLCIGLLTFAVIAPAPVAAVPFVAAICVCAPMAAAWELPGAIAVLRHRPALAAVDGTALLAELRGHLDRLPETQHPLGL